MNFAFTGIGRKKTLRHLAGILIFIILFNFVDITVFAFADTTGPVIESITVDRIEATVGETITYTIQATDESDIAWIEMNVFYGVSRKYVNLIPQSDGTYKGILNIDNTYPNGLFQVESVSLNDMAGNQSNYSAEEIAVLNPNLGVTVIGSVEDNSGPVIESIAVDRAEATVGERITYTVQASDESDITWASMDVSFGENSRYVQLEPQSDGSYIGILDVDNSFLNGVYEVNSVTFNDSLGNYRNYFEEEIATINPSLSVIVTGSAEDTVGPVLKAIMVDKVEATVGNIITYTVEATDESGLSIIFMSVSYGDSMKYISLTLQSDGTYKGMLDVNNAFLNGIYQVKSLSLTDTSGNYRNFSAEEITALNPNLDVTVTGSAEDIVGPVIESITVDKTEVTAGDIVTYTIKASDKSGLAWSSMDVSFGEKGIFVYLSLESDGTYKGTLEVNNSFLNGKYEVISASLRDTSGNFSHYSAEEISSINPNLGVTVTGSAEDTVGPVMESIKVDRTEATVGDMITYTIQATDESGLAWGSMDVSFGDSVKYVNLNLEQDGTFKGTLNVNNAFLNEIYKVEFVTLNDSSGNQSKYSAEELEEINPNLGVTVTGSAEDTVEPELETIAVDKTEAIVGDIITYTVQASDEFGLASIFLNISSGESWKSISLTLQADGTYKGTLNISNSFLNSTYRVNSVYIADESGNTGTYSEEEISAINPNLGVTVTGSTEDITGPIIESITVDKTEATVGEKITYTVQATDESGLYWAHISISSGEDARVADLILQTDGTYKGTFEVNDTFMNSIYKVDAVSLRDKVENYSDYTKEEIAKINSSLDVTVVGSLEDTAGPVIESITADKTEATVGDIITYTIQASDESGISWMYLALSSGAIEQGVELTLQSDGTYKGKLYVNNAFINETYKVNLVSISDTLDNYRDYSEEEITAINPSLEVTIFGSAEDTLGPVIESITVDKTEATVGDSITYTIQASDVSGVYMARIDLSFGESWINVDLKRMVDGTYKGTIVVNNSFSNGLYKIDAVTLYDKLDNHSTYYPEELAAINSTLGVTIMGSAEDTVTPLIESITMDKTEATVGDIITFTMQASDESGLSWASIGLSFGENMKYVRLTSQSDGSLKGTLNIDHSYLNGAYEVDQAYIADKVGNESYYLTQEISAINPNLRFTVMGSAEDTAGPIIESITVDKTEATVGDTVTYTMEIYDESDIVEGPTMIFDSEMGYLSIRFEKQENGTYKGKITIDHSFSNRVYKLLGITLSDTFDNIMYYDGGSDEIRTLNPNLDFSVKESAENLEKPVIDFTTLRKEYITVTSGDAVKISVSVTDNFNPIKSVSISFFNQVYPFSDENLFKSFPMTYNPETDRYESLIMLSDRLETGLWEVFGIIVNQGMPNEIELYNNDWDLSAGNFIVEDAIQVTSIALDTTEINFDKAGVTQNLIATVLPSNASNKTVTWTSSDELVATVSKDGTVTAVGNGTSTIIATSVDGGKTASCKVNVQAQKDYSGIYNIRSVNSDLVMDVYDGGTKEGTNIIQWGYHGRENQQWRFESLGNGYYKITSVLNPTYSLDVYDAGTSIGNRVIQWTYHGGTNQQWKVMENADGSVSLMSRLAAESGTRYVLDVFGGGKEPGVNVIQWSGNGGDNQKWQLEPVKTYTMSYDSNGGSAVASSSIRTDALAGEPQAPTKEGMFFGGWYKNQALTTPWNFATDRMPAEDTTLYAKWQTDLSGTYFIRSVNSNLVMDVYNGGTTEGTNIIQWGFHGRENQQWRFESLGNGYYKITSVLNPTYSLDVYDAGTSIGNRVIQWTYHGGTNQQWKVTENADGSVTLMSRLAVENGTGYVLDVFGGGLEEGVNVIQWSGNGGDNQKWNLEAVN